ncbi:MAG: marine proteobacterial sortase target protein, partial [Alphaproteobacteria bacterium]
DLYHGEPVVLAVKIPGKIEPGPKDELLITGIHGGRQWRHKLNLSGARMAKGISTLWARARITSLMDSLREGANPDSVRKSVTGTALRHKLVSRYTSLIAVSKKVARPDGAALTSRKLPLNLPHGWNYEKIFGELRAKPAPASAQHAALRSGGTQIQLPQGATPAMLNIWIGLLALMAATGLLLWRRAQA